MKRLILYISIVFFSIISYSQEVVRPLVKANSLADIVYLSGDSTYLINDADSIWFVVDSDSTLLLRNTGTSQILVGDGTAALPSNGFINDPTTGMHLYTINNLRLGVNGRDELELAINVFQGTASNKFAIKTQQTISSTIPNYTFRGDENTGTNRAGPDSLSLIAGGVEGIRIAEGGGKIKVSITDTLQVNGLYNGYQMDGVTSLYYHEHNVPAFSAAPGAAGAILTVPTANTLGGYQLDANTEQLYFSIHMENDWDGATDITVCVYWEVNEAAASDGTVDLQLICYYKGDHEAANKTQTLEVEHTITGNKAQYTQHRTTFTVNWDEAANVVEAADIISFILNLETDTSECDDIIINHMCSRYQTTKPAPETY